MKHLFFGAHCDDVEIGCGGLIQTLIRDGQDVKIVNFSATLPDMKKNSDVICRECLDSMALLGVTDINILEYQANYFPSSFNDIRKEIERYLRTKVDVVYSPSPDCSHQDHHTLGRVCNVAMRRRGTLISYETVQHPCFIPNTFHEISGEELDIKVKAISKYKSQSSKVSFKSETWKAMAIIRGNQIGVKYAEGFIIKRRLI